MLYQSSGLAVCCGAQLSLHENVLSGCVQPWAHLNLQGAAGTPLQKSAGGGCCSMCTIKCECGVPHRVRTQCDKARRSLCGTGPCILSALHGLGLAGRHLLVQGLELPLVQTRAVLGRRGARGHVVGLV